MGRAIPSNNYLGHRIRHGQPRDIFRTANLAPGLMFVILTRFIIGFGLSWLPIVGLTKLLGKI